MMKKKVFCYLLFAEFLCSVVSSQSAIVFDGMNSYSTYSGAPYAQMLAAEHIASGVTILLQDTSPGQIDYSKEYDQENRTSIQDPKGMFIEAEGIYSFLKGNCSPQIYRISENQVVLSRLREISFAYKVIVKKPGTYRFVVDASDNIDQSMATLRLFATNEEGMKIEANDTWVSKFSTGSWSFYEENFGGISRVDPFFVDLEMNQWTTGILFVFDSIRGFNIDRFRVVGFEERANNPAEKMVGHLNLSSANSNSLFPVSSVKKSTVEASTKKSVQQNKKVNPLAAIILLGIPLFMGVLGVLGLMQKSKR